MAHNPTTGHELGATYRRIGDTQTYTVVSIDAPVMVGGTQIARGVTVRYEDGTEFTHCTQLRYSRCRRVAPEVGLMAQIRPAPVRPVQNRVTWVNGRMVVTPIR